VSVDCVALVEKFGAVWAAHDLDATIAFLSEECLFDATGPAPDGTTYVGTEDIREAWRGIFEDGSTSFEPEETFGSGDRVVQRWRYKWAGGHVRGVDVFKVTGGLITEKLSYAKGRSTSDHSLKRRSWDGFVRRIRRAPTCGVRGEVLAWAGDRLRLQSRLGIGRRQGLGPCCDSHEHPG
jgi:SnoaL-like domain